MTQVLLVNPDVMVRKTLARLLERESDLEVHERPNGKIPDVVVVNVLDRDTLRSVRVRYPTSRIVARLSVLGPDLWSAPEIDRALDSIAPYDQLVQAIRDVASLGAVPTRED